MIIDPYISRGNYKDEDVFVICSDGLTDMVAEEEIEAIIRKNSDLKKISEDLLFGALENGGRDNVSVAVVLV